MAQGEILRVLILKFHDFYLSFFLQLRFFVFSPFFNARFSMSFKLSWGLVPKDNLHGNQISHMRAKDKEAINKLLFEI